MPPLWIGLALFIVVDALVVWVVLKNAMSRRSALGVLNVGDVAQFAGAAAEETRVYMAANYGGDPGSLPGVLQGLVDRLAQRAGEQGLTFDRETLKQIAGVSVISLKAAPPPEVRSALKSMG